MQKRQPRIIGERLHEVSRRAAETADAGSEKSVLPVLASRAAAVEQEMQNEFPQTKTLKTSISNGQGVLAGQAAGRRADLGTTGLARQRTALR